jgi:hypothetical protein
MAIGLTPTANANRQAACMRMNGSVRTQSMRSAAGWSDSKLDARAVSNQCSTARARRVNGLFEAGVTAFMGNMRMRIAGLGSGRNLADSSRPLP